MPERMENVVAMPDSAPCIRLEDAQDNDRLKLMPAGQGFQLLDTQTGGVLGTLALDADASHEVSFFRGKGGLMATVHSPDGILYFALPGSHVQVGGVILTLSGETIRADAQKPPARVNRILPQTATHQATILGAGLATRFEKISGNTTNRAKPGVPLIGTQTVIECLANVLAQHHFRRIIVNTFFKPESIKASLAQSDAETVLYIDEDQPSGTAGGLRKMLMLPEYEDFLDHQTVAGGSGGRRHRC